MLTILHWITGFRRHFILIGLRSFILLLSQRGNLVSCPCHVLWCLDQETQPPLFSYSEDSWKTSEAILNSWNLCGHPYPTCTLPKLLCSTQKTGAADQGSTLASHWIRHFSTLMQPPGCPTSKAVLTLPSLVVFLLLLVQKLFPEPQNSP